MVSHPGAATLSDVDTARHARRAVIASTIGTMIEWYDFYIFGSLAAVISTHFYPEGSATVNFLRTLATFAVGFAVRPFGALVFGRIGDIVGRKIAFLITLLIMGGSTAAIGLLPGHATIGILAPILLVTLRLLQGLALGGEYVQCAHEASLWWSRNFTASQTPWRCVEFLAGREPPCCHRHYTRTSSEDSLWVRADR